MCGDVEPGQYFTDRASLDACVFSSDLEIMLMTRSWVKGPMEGLSV